MKNKTSKSLNKNNNSKPIIIHPGNHSYTVPIVVIDADCVDHVICLPAVPRQGEYIDGELFDSIGEQLIERVVYTEPDHLTPYPHVTLIVALDKNGTWVDEGPSPLKRKQTRN